MSCAASWEINIFATLDSYQSAPRIRHHVGLLFRNGTAFEDNPHYTWGGIQMATRNFSSARQRVIYL